jgi:palmitoyl-protein thioesterase
MRLSTPLSLALPLLAGAGARADGDEDTPLPLVVWHGLGDSYDRLGPIAELADSIHPGTLTYIISLGSDPASDSRATFVGDVSEQVEMVCQKLAEHPILSTAPAIDALGFSQGGVFLRAYVERCNNPPVRSLVTMGSPHSGVVKLMSCGSNWVCEGMMRLFRMSAFSSYVQSHFVPAQYYRPDNEEQFEQYLESSGLLADINNEREIKNTTYADGIAKLENFVMILFDEDTKVVPKESAWFEDYKEESSIPLRARKMYREDWIGLKALDRKGGLYFETAPGEHMQFDNEYLADLMKKFYGPAKSSKSREEPEHNMGDL